MVLKTLLVLILYTEIIVYVSVAEQNEKYSHDDFKAILSKTPSEVQRKAALEVIARLLPDHSHLFHIQIDHWMPVNSFRLYKGENDAILNITASSGVAACKGFHYYFKHKLGGHVSWSGNRIPEIPAILPSIDLYFASPSTFIYHQNVCTWSYSYAWWTWTDWQKHIDWMALMGISLTIAPIQEAIWTKVYRKFGLTDNEINEHFAGPGFQAWQRMGNIRGWDGPLSSNYRQQQMQLQKQIIVAERQLGMSVAIPAFAGHVPTGFHRLYPNLTLTPVQRWNNFPDDFCCPLFVDPEQDLFRQIGSAFLQETIDEYGSDHIYFSDPFNEIQPRKAEAEYLGQTSMNIYRAMKQVDPDAIWLLQGWMFVKNPFWSEKLIEAFLTAVPLGRIVVLDLQSELYPQYERTKSYFKQPFIWCMLHNFGGTLGMQGSVGIVNREIGAARNLTDSTMIGVGITMEGIDQNYVMYEFALDRGWWKEEFDEKDWFDRFHTARYGIESSAVLEAIDLLRSTVYAYKGPEKLHGHYTITNRPSVKWKPWSWYDPQLLQTAWSKFLMSNSSHLQNVPLYRHDLVDLTRQFLQNKADELFVNIISHFNSKNLTAVRALSSDMLGIFDDLDRILGTHSKFLLGRWLNAAKSLATSDLEQLMYEYNARNQITIWGPRAQINDYANKQWAGLMSDYYRPRWRMFLRALELSLQYNRNYSEKKFHMEVFRYVESPFTYDRKIYSDQPIGDTVEISWGIYNKWRNYENEGYLVKKVPVIE